MRLELNDFPPDVLDAIADRIVARLLEAHRPPAATDGYVTRAEAVRLGLERKALLRAERTGELEAFRVGKRVVYRRADLDAFVARHPVAHEPAATEPVAEVLPMDPFERALVRAERRNRDG